MTKNKAPVGGALVSMMERAVSRLRNAIMQGELRPAQKMTESTLRSELGVSGALLREVLQVLEAERLIETSPNRGYCVASLDSRQIEDIHHVWALLAGEAVCSFTHQANTGDIAECKRFLAQLVAAVKAQKPLEQLAAVNALFTYVLNRCGNRVLIEMVWSLVLRVNFLRAQSLRYPGWGYLCAQEIQDVISAVQAADPQAARAATRRHINSACAAAKQAALLTARVAVGPRAAPDQYTSDVPG